MYRRPGAYILCVAAIFCICGEPATAQESQQSAISFSLGDEQRLLHQERSTWRLEMGNDALFDSDNQFTHGFSVQKHSAVFADLNDLDGPRAFGRGLARRILPQSSDLLYRKALNFGQTIITPDRIKEPDIRLDDTPYLGLLAAEKSWIAFNDSRFVGFAMMAGIVGEMSGAEHIQKKIHAVIGANQPRGWEHQLSNEPVLNFYYMRKRKLWNGPSFDGAFSTDVTVGNFTTGITAGMEMRVGRKSEGFAYVYNPIGKGMVYDATLSRQDRQMQIYGSLALRARAWAVYMPLEGNTFVSGNEWTDNNTIAPKKVIGQAIAGFHVVGEKWGAHLTVTIATDNIDEDTLAPGLAVENNFGTLAVEWRF